MEGQEGLENDREEWATDSVTGQNVKASVRPANTFRLWTGHLSVNHTKNLQIDLNLSSFM